jgi:hypothetical protein
LIWKRPRRAAARGGNTINPGRRRKADGMPDITVNSPRLSDRRLKATGLMPYRPSPFFRVNNADDVSASNFLDLVIKIHAIGNDEATH